MRKRNVKVHSAIFFIRVLEKKISECYKIQTLMVVTYDYVHRFPVGFSRWSQFFFFYSIFGLVLVRQSCLRSVTYDKETRFNEKKKKKSNPDCVCIVNEFSNYCIDCETL